MRIVDSGFTREKNNKAYMRNKAFPTSEVIELRRLADEYKVILFHVQVKEVIKQDVNLVVIAHDL